MALGKLYDIDIGLLPTLSVGFIAGQVLSSEMLIPKKPMLLKTRSVLA